MVLAVAISGYIQGAVTCTENGHIINKSGVSMQCSLCSWLCTLLLYIFKIHINTSDCTSMCMYNTVIILVD